MTVLEGIHEDLVKIYFIATAYVDSVYAIRRGDVRCVFFGFDDSYENLHRGGATSRVDGRAR